MAPESTKIIISIWMSESSLPGNTQPVSGADTTCINICVCISTYWSHAIWLVTTYESSRGVIRGTMYASYRPRQFPCPLSARHRLSFEIHDSALSLTLPGCPDRNSECSAPSFRSNSLTYKAAWWSEDHATPWEPVTSCSVHGSIRCG